MACTRLLNEESSFNKTRRKLLESGHIYFSSLIHDGWHKNFGAGQQGITGENTEFTDKGSNYFR